MGSYGIQIATGYAVNNDQWSRPGPQGRNTSYLKIWGGVGISTGAREKKFLGNVRGEFEVFKGFKLGTFYAMERKDFLNQDYESRYSRNQYLNGANGFAAQGTEFQYNNTLEGTASYNRTLGMHNVSVLGGYTFQDFSAEGFSASNSNFLVDNFTYNNLGAGQRLSEGRAGMGSFKNYSRLIAFFGRAIYNFNDKYLLTASVRREGSSKFGNNNKWGWFPAVSVGWRLSQEGFLKDIPFLSDLKVRAGYGVTGNQDFGAYRSLILLGTGARYLYDGQYLVTYGPSGNPNPNLRWEKKGEINLGVDFGFLNNRLSGSLDVYNRLTTDLLFDYNVQVPAYLNGTIFANVGEVRNRGIELSLNAVPFDGKFKWNATFNIAYNHNELVTLSDEVFKRSFEDRGGLPSPGNLGNAYRLQGGQPIGSFYGKKFAGFTEDGKWLFYNRNGETVTTDKIVEEDKQFLGQGTPKLNSGFTNMISYGNFDLTIFLRGSFLYDILNLKNIYYGNRRFLPDNILETALDSPLNDDPQYSDFYLEKGTAFRDNSIPRLRTSPTLAKIVPFR